MARHIGNSKIKQITHTVLMRKAVKIIGIIVAVPVFLFFILASLFYFPPFQSWAVKRVTSITSEKTGMEITVERNKSPEAK